MTYTVEILEFVSRERSGATIDTKQFTTRGDAEAWGTQRINQPRRPASPQRKAIITECDGSGRRYLGAIRQS